MKHSFIVWGGLSEGARLQSFAVKHNVVIDEVNWSAKMYIWRLKLEGSQQNINSFACECDMWQRGLTEAVNAG